MGGLIGFVDGGCMVSFHSFSFGAAFFMIAVS
uniref:Uncharacterized protein n=1 Tax=Rhizophora mucronata TaxID=61149 RepID=A0A2P2N585_RHIMU